MEASSSKLDGSEKNIDISGDQKLVRCLHHGEHFGEIAIVSNLKRTCSVTSSNYATLAVLSRSDIAEFRDLFTDTAYDMMNSMVEGYNDEEMEERRMFIQNIPYFTAIQEEKLLTEIVLLIREEYFSMG